MDLEPRLLRTFVAVAETGGFTRAAERLHLAQPAVSQHVRQLEQRLGVRLLDRSTRHVALTPAGAALLERAPAALAALEDAARAVQAAAAGERGELTVGLLATAALDVTPAVLRAFAAARPNVAVHVRNVGFRDPAGGVRDRETDLAIVWLPFDDRGLVTEPLFDDERVAVLAATHPLAARERLDAAELARQPFVWVEGIDPVAGDFWTLADHRDGDPPIVGARVTGFEDLFAAVRAGLAVAANPVSIAAGLPWDDLVTRPVDGLRPATVALCRRADDDRPLVHAFIEAARAVVAG